MTGYSADVLPLTFSERSVYRSVDYIFSESDDSFSFRALNCTLYRLILTSYDAHAIEHFWYSDVFCVKYKEKTGDLVANARLSIYQLREQMMRHAPQ